MKLESSTWTYIALVLSIGLNTILLHDAIFRGCEKYIKYFMKFNVTDTSSSQKLRRTKILSEVSIESEIDTITQHRSLNEHMLPLNEIGKEIDIKIFKDLKVHVIFFAYLSVDRNWWYSLESFSMYMIETGLFDRADSIHICLSTTTNRDWFTDFTTREPPTDHTEAMHRLKNATNIFNRHLSNYLHKIHFDITLGNVFEFPGVIRMWTLASHCDDSIVNNSIYLYFHAKGIALHGQLQPGKQPFSHYFYNVVGHWKYALKYFALDPTLSVACTDSMPGGFCNGNHFWARGSFLRTVKRPKRSNDRYYYEHWLSHREKEPIFPSNYTLNFDYVQFNESYNENWRYGYVNGNLDGYWDINAEHYRGKKIDGHELE